MSEQQTTAERIAGMFKADPENAPKIIADALNEMRQKLAASQDEAGRLRDWRLGTSRLKREQNSSSRIQSTLDEQLYLIPHTIEMTPKSAEIGGTEEAARTIAAEIDGLTRERDEARAEVERLRVYADAWDSAEGYQAILLGEASEGWDVRLRAAFVAREKAVARARDAAKDGR